MTISFWPPQFSTTPVPYPSYKLGQLVKAEHQPAHVNIHRVMTASARLHSLSTNKQYKRVNQAVFRLCMKPSLRRPDKLWVAKLVQAQSTTTKRRKTHAYHGSYTTRNLGIRTDPCMSRCAAALSKVLDTNQSAGDHSYATS